MKTVRTPRTLITAIIAASALGSSGQTCADLSIASVTYSAFYDSLIEVRLLNSGPIGWSYPSLIVYDPDGDTLAFHPADLFALTDDQTIILSFVDGAAIPNGPTTGTIELWTGFNTTLECTFDVTYDLCPAAPCLPLRPFMFTNESGMMPAHIPWQLQDSVGTATASGMFHLDSMNTYVNDSACLAPGNYSMVIDPGTADTEHLYFGIGSSAWNSPTLQYHLMDETSFAFTVLESCMEGSNTIPEVMPASVRMTMDEGMLTIMSTQEEPLERVELWDARGRQLLSTNVTGHTTQVDLRGMAAGVYPVRVWIDGSPMSAKAMVE